MTPTQTASPAGLALQVRRVIRGNRQRIFDAWTKPELLRQWFAPAALKVKEFSNDLRVGGAYRIQMEGNAECAPPPGAAPVSRNPVATGRYTEIVPGERLSFTWRGDWGEIGDTLVTIEFKDVPGGTEVILTHTNFATKEMAEGHNRGWNECFDKLAKFVEA